MQPLYTKVPEKLVCNKGNKRVEMGHLCCYNKEKVKICLDMRISVLFGILLPERDEER